MSSENKTNKDKSKKNKKKTRVDDLEPHKDDDAKGGASLTLASATTDVSDDLLRVARKITPVDDVSYKITPISQPTKR